MRVESNNDCQPRTSEKELGRDLKRLGVKAGMTLIVHSSLSSIGWVPGGAATVIRALLGVIGETGNLAMPSATPRCADPAMWPEPEISEARLAALRTHLPLFNPQTTPTDMGAIAETFRTWPGTMRSAHPLESVCAFGPMAAAITKDHPLAFSEGVGTPFDKLHQLDSWILLLGVGFNRCTALHYAESLVENRRTTRVRFPAMKNNRRIWIEVQNVANDNDTHFPDIGKKFRSTGKAKSAAIGNAPSSLFRMRELISFAKEYFAATF